jgi:hypothetical protein
VLLGSTIAVAWSISAPAHAEVGGAVGGGRDEIGSWVIGKGPGGGVRPPSAQSVCTPWDHAANISADAGVVDLGTVRVDDAGVIWNLYFRDCDGTRQFVWVPTVPPAQLGRIAFDQLMKQLPKPTPRLSPDASVGGYVNFETWLSVLDPGVLTATSSIPGLSATARARVVRIEWQPGDGESVVCQPFGALPPTPDFVGAAPCGHTYRWPSHPKVTGSGDGLYRGSLTLVWEASWSASNGASGSLGEARSSTPFTYRVREIQTIGLEG